jgi:hypothetical protein
MFCSGRRRITTRGQHETTPPKPAASIGPGTIILVMAESISPAPVGGSGERNSRLFMSVSDTKVRQHLT